MRACSLNAAYHPALCGAGIGSTAAPGAVAAPTTAPQSVRPFLLRKSSSLGLHPYEPKGKSLTGSRCWLQVSGGGAAPWSAAAPGSLPGPPAQRQAPQQVQTDHAPSAAHACLQICMLVCGMDARQLWAAVNTLCHTTSGFCTRIPCCSAHGSMTDLL